MPILFAGPPGRVAVMDDPGVDAVLPPLLNLSRTALSFRQRKSIVTRVTVAQQTSQQFMHTLGGDVYVYVFGDRIGEMIISGISIAYDCDRPGDTEHGIEKVFRWYQANRASKRRTPLLLQLGRKTTFYGFLTNFGTDVLDHKMNLMQYRLGLHVLPEAD